jgi:hypothetical protein
MSLTSGTRLGPYEIFSWLECRVAFELPAGFISDACHLPLCPAGKPATALNHPCMITRDQQGGDES